MTEKPMSVMDKKYQLEDDVRTLKNAEKIKADKERMELAKTEMGKELKAIKQVIGKDYANEMNKKGEIKK
ncbi:MAG: hypothetical protein Q8L68_00875 [Methylococcales bacterium]|nr:hypothetical protein [Methylococcales bacterium]